MPLLTTLPFVVRPGEGLHAPLGPVGTVHKVPGAATEGRLAIVEHTLRPRYLATPMHRHSREDELSIVLAGQLGVKLGDEVVVATAGSYVLKPRGQWHAYWNAGDTELRFIELLVPAGVEGYFEELSRLFATVDAPLADEVQRLADQYGLQLDFQSVSALCQQFQLRF
jgi:mannose-6-phosphate isomerase-like protein (cupin superfamily)